MATAEVGETQIPCTIIYLCLREAAAAGSWELELESDREPWRSYAECGYLNH